MHGSGPKQTSSSLTSTVLKCGKFTYNKVVPKLYLNCALIEAEVEIQFLRVNCNIIEATDVSCGMKISQREVLNFHISDPIRRKKVLETGKCSVV